MLLLYLAARPVDKGDNITCSAPTTCIFLVTSFFSRFLSYLLCGIFVTVAVIFCCMREILHWLTLV